MAERISLLLFFLYRNVLFLEHLTNLLVETHLHNWLDRISLAIIFILE